MGHNHLLVREEVREDYDQWRCHPCLGIHLGSTQTKSLSLPTTWSKPSPACSTRWRVISSSIPSFSGKRKFRPRPFTWPMGQPSQRSRAIIKALQVQTTALSAMTSSWGYTSESSTRLWEELTPVPTRKSSIRFITTMPVSRVSQSCCGNLYKQVSKDEHPEGEGECIHPDLPIFANRKARLFAYWDHEPRMPWQTQEY